MINAAAKHWTFDNVYRFYRNVNKDLNPKARTNDHNLSLRTTKDQGPMHRTNPCVLVGILMTLILSSGSVDSVI